jgi:hypothetical protein
MFSLVACFIQLPKRIDSVHRWKIDRLGNGIAQKLGNKSVTLIICCPIATVIILTNTILLLGVDI